MICTHITQSGGDRYSLLYPSKDEERGPADVFRRRPEWTDGGDTLRTGDGLTLTAVEPFRRCRIVYSGMMR